VTEVANMGHGLQMWLQTIWFLARTDPAATVILDEPDVYMHPDLQRRLIRLVRNRYMQTIIATHSVEIMAEVEPENILVVDKDRRRSMFASSIPAVQEVIEHIGGIHNLHLARLASARKCLLVEGKDVDILRYVQNLLFPGSALPLDTVPNIPVGGWGGFHYAIGIAKLIKETGEERIRTYCIFDHDYHSDQEVCERVQRAKDHGVDLHIWHRKEIENYLVSAAAVYRIIASHTKVGTSPSSDEVVSHIDHLVRDLEQETTELIATELQKRERGMALQSAMEAARAIVQARWSTPEGRLSLVSGKHVLAKIAEWAKTSFGATVTLKRILRELKTDEVPDELVAVVSAIEAGDSLIART